MKSKLLFLPDVLLLLFICLTCERHESRHSHFGTTGETVFSSIKTEKSMRIDKNKKEDEVWEAMKENITEQFIGIKAQVWED